MEALVPSPVAVEVLPSQELASPMEDVGHGNLGNVSIAESMSTETPSRLKVDVHVCRKSSIASEEEIIDAVKRVLRRNMKAQVRGTVAIVAGEEPVLDDNVTSITLDCTENVTDEEFLFFWQIDFDISVYQVFETRTAAESDEEGEVASFNAWQLPSVEFDGLWESLHYDDGVKQRLVRYLSSALHFSDLKVNPKLVTWNRVVLLFGPPGTGKTSLCKGLAHKLAVKYSRRYSDCQLVEVNAHSLFSKWFSESAKLVTKLFEKIRLMIENNNSLVLVLIDEVESLSAARQAALAGSDPSDSIRVVNALLTQLDSLKNYPNVLILATSNITQAIDIAFIDRADIKAYIGPPSVHSIFDMLCASVCELQRAGVISGGKKVINPCPFANAQGLHWGGQVLDEADTLGKALLQVSERCHGMSGRTLRRLPFLAHADFSTRVDLNMDDYLSCLVKAVEKEREDCNSMTKHETK